MKIKVEFYSVLRDLAGAHEIEVEVADGTTMRDLLAQLHETVPGLREWDSKLLLAAGLDYVERTHVIREGEVISIMPPVQGG